MPEWTINIDIYKKECTTKFFHKQKWCYGCLFRFECWSRECLFQALYCSVQLLDKITVLVGVYMLRILVIGDCFIDQSQILAFVCKNFAVLTEFQTVDGSARWQTNFNFNHTPLAGTLPSTGHCWPTAQLLLCLSCAPQEETFCSSSKSHTDQAAIRNWLVKSNHWYFELITDYLNNVESEYQDIRRTLRNAAAKKSRDFKAFLPFSTRRKTQTWLSHWYYSSYT